MNSKVIGEEYLPANYKFELDKTIRQIKRRNSKKVALQFPEGIIHLSTIISDILKSNTDIENVVILSDVVYGACCIDDISSYLIGCDLLIHYGHSCLFEIPKCLVEVVYVFVEISIDTSHCVDTVLNNIDFKHLSVLGTIQYNSAVRKIKKSLEEKLEAIGDQKGLEIPRAFPLSTGEVLGCTSPKIRTNNVLFVSEGRFHLESLMINNPHKNYFRYCPSTKILTREEHDYKSFLEFRNQKKLEALKCTSFLVVFGTLGRQGGTSLLNRITESLRRHNRRYSVVFLSEIDEELIRGLEDSTAVIEVACPRIAIDWGTLFSHPLITPFEYFMLESPIETYPMDYYAKKEEKQPWQMLH